MRREFLQIAFFAAVAGSALDLYSGGSMWPGLGCAALIAIYDQLILLQSILLNEKPNKWRL